MGVRGFGGRCLCPPDPGLAGWLDDVDAVGPGRPGAGDLDQRTLADLQASWPTVTAARSTHGSGTPNDSSRPGLPSPSNPSAFDNGRAETINGLLKTELIKSRLHWRTADQLGRVRHRRVG